MAGEFVIVVRSENDEVHEIIYDVAPDQCPFCHRHIDSRVISGYIHNDKKVVELIVQCPRNKCHHLFIGTYISRQYNEYDLILVIPSPRFIERKFSEYIQAISPMFIEIYNQAENAEHSGFDKIAGPGYRKALEFLIKDYVCNKKPDLAENTRTAFLGKIITDHIDEKKIQSTAKRAAWLGNDETHYYKKWADRDITDLKLLIELTVRWIESEEMTINYEKEMNE